MSSTLSTTEIQTISNKKPPMVLTRPHFKMEDKRLVRTSSLEKIRRFNTYICSQQYYILPALLAWLRSSQSVLQSSTETTIFLFRSLMFNFVYKLYQLEFRALIRTVSHFVLKQIQRTCDSVESVYVLKTAVYLTALILISELCLCFYLLFNTHVPGGLIFLIVCWFYIIYLNLRSVFFLKEKRKPSAKKRKAD